MKMCTLKSCCICMKQDSILISVSSTDEHNMHLSTKLMKCVPEIEWTGDLLICESCFQSANLSYIFHDMCINSESLQNHLKTVTLYEINTADDCIGADNNCMPPSHESDDEKDKFICDTCNTSFENATLLNEHKKVHVYICYHCNKHCRNKSTLVRHIKLQHFTKKANNRSSIDSITITNSIKPEPVSDNIINESKDLKTNNNKATTEKKNKTKTRITKFTCEDCPEFFKTSKKLIEHATKIHGKSKHSVKPFQCSKCDSRFASSSNLVQHKKYHEGNRTNICSYCGKGFITTSDLINHEKQHLNKREYKCEVCCKGFNTHKDLRSHRIIKHKDPSTWNYHCSLCNKRFHIKPNYDNHMRRHVGDKRFSCRICTKCFITKDELRKHMISHTNIRAYRCMQCGKEYKDKRVLEIHMVKIHGIGNAKVPVRVRKHLCNLCPKAFYDKNKLMRHMCTHSGEKPFPCQMCDKKFTDKSYLKRHLKMNHNMYKIESYPDA